MPIASKTPMLAVPKCGLNVKLEKLQKVVSELKKTPRAVLLCRTLPLLE